MWFIMIYEGRNISLSSALTRSKKSFEAIGYPIRHPDQQSRVLVESDIEKSKKGFSNI